MSATIDVLDASAESALPLAERAALDAVKRLPVEVLHRDEVLAVVDVDLVRLDDVRVVESRRDARLVDEHRDEVGVLDEVRTEPLDHGELREAGAEGAGDHREEDLRHPTMP